MKFEDLATKAGQEAQRVATSVAAPSLSEARSRLMLRRSRVVVAGAVVAVAAVFAVVALRPPTTEGLPPMDDPTSTSTTVPQTTSTPTIAVAPLADGPLFGAPTNVVIVFDDGLGGILALDPDQSIGSVTAIDGQKAGDQPYRLTRVGDTLAVGWGSIYVADLRTRQSVKLSDAVIYVPAVEPDRLWMVDYESGRIEGTPTVWQMTIDGEVVTEPQEIPVEGYPATGIRGGLAIEMEKGIGLWDADSGEVVQTLGVRPALVAGAAGDLLAWCEGTCEEMHVTNLATGEDAVAAPEGELPFAGAGRALTTSFSPDGSVLAARAGDDLVLIDTVTGDALQTYALGGPEQFFIGWSRDGSQIFAATFSYGKTSMALLRISPGDGIMEGVQLPFGGTMSFVVLDAAEAKAFIIDEHQPVSACNREADALCGFHLSPEEPVPIDD